MKLRLNGYVPLIVLIMILYFSSCKKFVDAGVPDGSITSGDIYSDPQRAQAAVSSIYGLMINEKNLFSGALTVFTSCSSDELLLFNPQPASREFMDNHISPANANNEKFWQDCYRYIYLTNAAIQGIGNSSLPDSLKNQLMGECYFLRAFYYFYLHNLFGKCPLVLTPDYTVSEQLGPASAEALYAQMISDLRESKLRLEENAGEFGRIRANKWSASALLARVYLYRRDWLKALEESSQVIDSKRYSLNEDLRGVFKAGSSEAILQLQPLDGYIAEFIQFYYPTLFGLSSYSTSYLLNTFEPMDLRRKAWFDSTTRQSIIYKYPGKYKSITFSNEEYYMVLRYAEQYLIRAEARAYLGDLSGACNDLYMIRKRAGLARTDAGSQVNLLKDIYHERRMEFFSEWGHRWFDLKRTGAADSVLGAIKPDWKSGYQYYPIPQSQLLANRNLSQNADY